MLRLHIYEKHDQLYQVYAFSSPDPFSYDFTNDLCRNIEDSHVVFSKSSA